MSIYNDWNRDTSSSNTCSHNIGAWVENVEMFTTLLKHKIFFVAEEHKNQRLFIVGDMKEEFYDDPPFY